MTDTQTVTIKMVIGYEDTLYVDDSRDGSCAGVKFDCDVCGSSIGYPDGFTPDTIEEAEAATFIPFVEASPGSPLLTDELPPEGANLCIGCVRRKR